jgi:hypothetical protein
MRQERHLEYLRWTVRKNCSRVRRDHDLVETSMEFSNAILSKKDVGMEQMECEMGIVLTIRHVIAWRSGVVLHHIPDAWCFGGRFSVRDDLTDSTHVGNVPARNPMKANSFGRANSFVYLEHEHVGLAYSVRFSHLPISSKIFNLLRPLRVYSQSCALQ